MVSTQFEGILKEFEGFFKCPLTPDSNNSCLIKMEIGISIQIELSRYGLVLIGCRIAALPMNRYRENLINTALKFNELTPPSTGIFGFSQKTQNLILFMQLDPNTLSDARIRSVMPPFIEKAKQWVDAIAKGETPTIAQTGSSEMPSGLFGLIT